MTAALLGPVVDLPRDAAGNLYGTAQQLADLLTSPERSISADRVRDWIRRSNRPGDRLYGMLPVVRVPGARTGTSWCRLDHAAAAERATRKG